MAGRDRHQIAQPLAGPLQFGGAVLDALLQLVMRLAELFLLTLACAEVGGEADHAGLLAVLVEQDRGRDQHGDARPSLALSTLSIARRRAAALAHLDEHFLGPLLAVVELDGRPADDLFGAIAEQGLGALVEEDDVAFLVRGDDGVWRAFDQPREVALSFLDLGVRLESRCSACLRSVMSAQAPTSSSGCPSSS